MEPISALVTSLMGILMPYAVKGAQEFAKAAGEVALEKAKKLIDTLKARLSGDKEASENLARFEEKPERYRPVLEDILKEKLTADKDLAAELKSLLQQMGPELEIIQRMKVADGVTGLAVDEMSGGKAKVQQEIDEAKNVTGATIKKLGG